MSGTSDKGPAGKQTTYWLLLGTEFGPEVALVSKVERGRNAIVGFLESDDPESTNVIYAV